MGEVDLWIDASDVAKLNNIQTIGSGHQCTQIALCAVRMGGW